METLNGRFHLPFSLTIILIACSLSISIKNCFAIYEDQIGINDWHQKYLGRVTHSKFLTTGQRKKFLVATEQNVLAALHLRTGEISWRNVLGENDSVSAIEVVGKYVYTLSGKNIIRSFGINDGALIWERTFSSSSPLHFLILPGSSENKSQKDLLVYNNKYTLKLHSLTGDVVWKTTASISKISFDSKGHPIILEHLRTENAFNIYAINELSGEITLNNKVILPDFDPSSVIISKNILFAQEKPKLSKHIFFIPVDEKNVQFQSIDVQSKLKEYFEKKGFPHVTLNGEWRLFDSDVNNGFLVSDKKNFCLFLRNSVTYDVATCVYDITTVGDIIKLDEDNPNDGAYCIGFISQKSDLSLIFKPIVFKSDSFEINEIKEEKFLISEERGRVDKIFVNSYFRKGQSNYGFRTLIVSQDDSFSLLQQENIVWKREEALASITNVKFVDLPVGRGEEISVSTIEHSLEDWIKIHWIRAKSSLMIASADEKEKLKQIRLNNPQKISSYRDHNGFRKLVIVFTRSGKILALHTGNGRIVWSRLTHLKFDKTDTYAIHLWKTPHKILETFPEILIIQKEIGNIQNTDTRRFSSLNAHTGELTSFSGPSFSVRLALPLPFVDSEERKLLLLISHGDNPRVQIFPSTEETREIFLKHLSKIFFYIVNAEDNSITGYGIENIIEQKNSGNGKADNYEDDQIFRGFELWKISFDKEIEKIVSTTSRRIDENVYTQAKVFSNRSMTFKYLSKNLLFVVTANPVVSSEKRILPENVFINAYLIHTISGKILFQNSHPGMGTPVHAVFSENWILYNYFDYFYYRPQFTVWELYDDSIEVTGRDAARYVFGLNQNFTNNAKSSWNLPLPTVLRQSYFFPSSVKYLAVTNTLNGITNKQILIATSSDQILAVDKRFFDPRRSLNPTPQDKEDGIVPYTDTFSIDAKSYVTHALRVEGLNGIVSEPSRLESTTLLFCYGLDLFFTRTAPSKMYDSLSEDFSYVLLLVTIVTLVLGILVSWFLSKRANLLLKWK